MSNLLKQRIIYICSIALSILTFGFLCLPFMTVYEKVIDAGVTKYNPVTLFGWDVMNPGIVDCVKGSEAEGIFLVFSFVILIATIALLVWGGLNLFSSFKTPDAKRGYKWFIIIELVYTLLEFCMAIAMGSYINYLNTADLANTGWSIFAFKAACGSASAAGPCVYVLLGLGAAITIITCVFTAMAKDNSLVLPYTKREIISSIVTIVACVAVFFITLCRFYYTTNYINTNIQSVYDSVVSTSGSDLSVNYKLWDGYEVFSFGAGGMEGYIRVLILVMWFVAICGILYNIFFLLAALGVFRINFDRKISNKINLALMVCGIMISVGCIAYSVGVNYQLGSNWTAYYKQLPLDSIWNTNMWLAESGVMVGFPQTVVYEGAFVVLYPIASYVGVRLINEYPD